VLLGDGPFPSQSIAARANLLELSGSDEPGEFPSVDAELRQIPRPDERPGACEREEATLGCPCNVRHRVYRQVHLSSYHRTHREDFFPSKM